MTDAELVKDGKELAVCVITWLVQVDEKRPLTGVEKIILKKAREYFERVNMAAYQKGIKA